MSVTIARFTVEQAGSSFAGEPSSPEPHPVATAASATAKSARASGR
ncbi:MAG: hypothetical protein OZ928_18920 [Polyangiaceae bacterium]|nr:hypothetical protein [Polyangiaceae bacterium]